MDMGARFCRRGAQFNASKPLVLSSKALLPPDLVTDKFKKNRPNTIQHVDKPIWHHQIVCLYSNVAPATRTCFVIAERALLHRGNTVWHVNEPIWQPWEKLWDVDNTFFLYRKTTFQLGRCGRRRLFWCIYRDKLFWHVEAIPQSIAKHRFDMLTGRHSNRKTTTLSDVESFLRC
jgi:hypothetical protein